METNKVDKASLEASKAAHEVDKNNNNIVCKERSAARHFDGCTSTTDLISDPLDQPDAE